MKSVFILNGPNLNLLGTRKPEVNGIVTLGDVEKECRDETDHLGLELLFRQSNHEGRSITWIHEAGLRVKRGMCIGAVLNPGALGHTSIALHDAIESARLPTVEVHIPNLYNRAKYRQHSYISPVAGGVIVGFSGYGYVPAINGLHQAWLRRSQPRSPVPA
jgi:3-dehydroquinate dehydratase II